MEAQWTIEEAEKNLPELIKAAARGEPQFICAKGRKEAIVISPETWKSEHLPDKPSFKEVLFSIPKGEPFIDETPSKELKLRDVEL